MSTVATAKQQDQFEKHHGLALQGNKESQFWVAECYFDGKCVEQNRGEAVKWYQQAADQKSGKATQKLGNCFFRGQGVEWNVTKGENLWKKSIPLLTAEAQEGDADAMYLLSEAFNRGRGVEPDNKQYLHWLRKAADEEHARAQVRLGGAYGGGRNSLERDANLAFSWFHRAAKNGNATGQYRLGRCYWFGEGVQTDLIQTLQWFQTAKENGFHGAQDSLEAVQAEISARRSHLVECVRHSLKRKKTPLSLWAHGLAMLVARKDQPAGFSPTFTALKALIPPMCKELQQNRKISGVKRPPNEHG